MKTDLETMTTMLDKAGIAYTRHRTQFIDGAGDNEELIELAGIVLIFNATEKSLKNIYTPKTEACAQGRAP